MSETKVCRGPSHPHGVVLPLTTEYWYHYKRGSRGGSKRGESPWSYMCRACYRHRYYQRRGENKGWTLLSPRARWAVHELVGRLGMMEACRRAELSNTTVRKMIDDRGTRRFHRESVLKVLLALREARQGGEMRHRDSVRYGATVRRESNVKGWTRPDGAVIPDHVRPPGRERKALRVSQQAGPVFPEIEALERREDAERQRAKRAHQKEQAERERRLLDLTGY